MRGRAVFVEELLETIEIMIDKIEEQGETNPELAVVHEIADQLREEIEALQDE